jgi:DNA-binding HxlR family transcriptional regulator
VPPRVEYQATALGKTLREPLAGLAHWMQAHAAELQAG